ncbi:MAG: hypothetical protein RL329_926, partial [Bacteroidota bacterium]
KRYARNRRTNHANRYQIPRRFFIGKEKRVIIAIFGGKKGNAYQAQKINHD